MTNQIGILLTNIGTPADPTSKSVRKYLNTFLSDPRVVEIPSLLWQPILKGLILPFRSKSSAKLYQKIWTAEGSPLLVISKSIADKLQTTLNCPVEIGMHYSHPTISQALNALHDKGCNKIIGLPLYPQYSAAATGSSFDLISKTLMRWRDIPELYFIKDYADHPDYIHALANSIKQKHTGQHLLFSFHGIPLRSVSLGDPYQKRCLLTATLVADTLQLKPHEWSVSFQSRLGKAQWLTPYTDHVLKELPPLGITDISVVAPGFAVDCLETLEELAIRGKEQFLSAGGTTFHYIPALNSSDAQIQLLATLVQSRL